MGITIHIDGEVQSDSIDVVMDFVEACVNKGMDLDDVMASMLCAVSAILEAEVVDEAEWQ